MLRAAIVPLLLVPLMACMPAGMNNNCEWPGVARATLVKDVRTAEELAMRFADTRFDSRAAHGRLRSQCEAKLFDRLSKVHGVGMAEIAVARKELSRHAFDPPVHLPLAALYLAAVPLVVRKIRHRFGVEERGPIVVAVLSAGLAMGLLLIVMGHLWDGAVEMLRVGNTHMSYRVERLGFREHTAAVFTVAVLVFWGAVAAAYRMSSGDPADPTAGRSLSAPRSRGSIRGPAAR